VRKPPAVSHRWVPVDWPPDSPGEAADLPTCMAPLKKTTCNRVPADRALTWLRFRIGDVSGRWSIQHLFPLLFGELEGAILSSSRSELFLNERRRRLFQDVANSGDQSLVQLIGVAFLCPHLTLVLVCDIGKRMHGSSNRLCHH
jgi:hypothetical protein